MVLVISLCGPPELYNEIEAIKAFHAEWKHGWMKGRDLVRVAESPGRWAGLSLWPARALRGPCSRSLGSIAAWTAGPPLMAIFLCRSVWEGLCAPHLDPCPAGQVLWPHSLLSSSLEICKFHKATAPS